MMAEVSTKTVPRERMELAKQLLLSDKVNAKQLASVSRAAEGLFKWVNTDYALYIALVLLYNSVLQDFTM